MLRTVFIHSFRYFPRRLIMQAALKMVRLIGAVQYDDDERFNYSSPKKVILSDFTSQGTWIFEIFNDNIQSILNLIGNRYDTVSANFETDNAIDYCVVVADNERDHQFFLTKCGLPAVRIMNEDYHSFVPSQRYEFLFSPEDFEEAYEKINKIGSYLMEKCIEKIQFDLIYEDSPSLYIPSEAVKMVRLIGTVQYDDYNRLNYKVPKKVILSDLTPEGTWTFIVKNDDVQSMANLVYKKYNKMSQKFNTDDTTDFCMILTDNRQDCEFFILKCGIPAIKIKHKDYFNFISSQKMSDDYHYILRDKPGFEECYERVLKIGSFSKGKTMTKVVCGLTLGVPVIN